MESLEIINKDFDNLRNSYSQLKGQIDYLQEKIEEKKEKSSALEIGVDELNKKVIFVKEISRFLREKYICQIEEICTYALEYVFRKGDKVKIITNSKVNKTSAEIIIIDKDNYEYDIQESKGGGIVDIISVMLRIVVKRLCNINGPLILDEPLKFLNSIEDDVVYITRIYELLNDVSKKFDMQIIMVTNQSKIIEKEAIRKNIDKVFIVENIDNKSSVREEE